MCDTGTTACQAKVIRGDGVSGFPQRQSDAVHTADSVFLMTPQMWHSACVALDHIKHTSGYTVQRVSAVFPK